VSDLGARLDTPGGREWLRRAAWTVLAVAVLALVVRGGSSPADPYLVDDDRAAVVDGQAAAGGRRPLAGFGEIAFTVIDPNGLMAEWCALLAETDAQRAQGLMDQTDLRGYDGMVFRYDAPIEGGFWMKSTLIPLAVAFFDEQGRFVSAQGMEPCPPELGDRCPVYRAEAPFVSAVEVPRGGLGALGIGPGSQIAFPGTPCA